MDERITIFVDEYTHNTLEEYFNRLPLPSRTNSEALAIFKSKAEKYEKGKELWESVINQEDRYAPWYTNVIIYLFKQIELSKNSDDLLYGAWMQLESQLSTLNTIVAFGTVANTRESNMVGVKNALLGIANAMKELNIKLKLALPTMTIQ